MQCLEKDRDAALRDGQRPGPRRRALPDGRAGGGVSADGQLPAAQVRPQDTRRRLATAAAFAALLLLGTVVSSWQAVRATTAEAQANANATQAQEKAQEATTQRDEAQKQRDEVRALNDRLQHTLYASDMNLAQHAWEAGDIRRVRELLERHRPHPGESDLRHFEWHYLNRLCHQELLTLRGSSARPAWPSARTASAWPPPTGLEKTPWSRCGMPRPGESCSPSRARGGLVAFSPDGKRLATRARSDQGPAVKMWDAQTGQELTTLHTGAVTSVAFSPDGKRLACGSTTWDSTKRAYGAGEVKVWDVQTGRELLVLKGHTGWVSVAYSPDGKRLASAGQKPDGKPLAGAGQKSGPAAVVGEVKVWDAETGQEVFTVEAPAYYRQTETVAYSPDGKRLIHVGVSGLRQVFDHDSVGCADRPGTPHPKDTRSGRQRRVQSGRQTPCYGCGEHVRHRRTAPD